MDKTIRSETIALDRTSSSNQDSDAEFVGWQETGSGNAFPLYNITAAGHPLRGSTVTDKHLREMKLSVPEAPPFESPIKKP